MTANDQFPRKWIITASSGGGGASNIALPACPGIVHVLTHMDVKVWGAPGAANGMEWDIEFPIGNIIVANAMTVLFTNNPAGSESIDSDSWDGAYPCGVGETMSVSQVAATPANSLIVLRAAGYDI